VAVSHLRHPQSILCYFFSSFKYHLLHVLVNEYTNKINKRCGRQPRERGGSRNGSRESEPGAGAGTEAAGAIFRRSLVWYSYPSVTKTARLKGRKSLPVSSK
jgi:hypothetical protein